MAADALRACLVAFGCGFVNPASVMIQYLFSNENLQNYYLVNQVRQWWCRVQRRLWWRLMWRAGSCSGRERRLPARALPPTCASCALAQVQRRSLIILLLQCCNAGLRRCSVLLSGAFCLHTRDLHPISAGQESAKGKGALLIDRSCMLIWVDCPSRFTSTSGDGCTIQERVQQFQMAAGSHICGLPFWRDGLVRLLSLCGFYALYAAV